MNRIILFLALSLGIIFLVLSCEQDNVLRVEKKESVPFGVLKPGNLANYTAMLHVEDGRTLCARFTEVTKNSFTIEGCGEHWEVRQAKKDVIQRDGTTDFTAIPSELSVPLMQNTELSIVLLDSGLEGFPRATLTVAEKSDSTACDC